LNPPFIPRYQFKLQPAAITPSARRIRPLRGKPQLSAIGENMADDKTKTCAHEPCECTVPENEKYCSNICRDAGSGETEIACQCHHPACEVSV
jgi:hypothetical protein